MIGDMIGGSFGTAHAALGRGGRAYAGLAVLPEIAGAGIGGFAGIRAHGGQRAGMFDAAVLGASYGHMAGSLLGAAFVKCFVAGTPVAIGTTTTVAAVEPVRNGSYRTVWIAFGLAAIAVSRLISRDQKRARRPNRRLYSSTPFVPAIPESTESDFLELDLTETCDE